MYMYMWMFPNCSVKRHNDVKRRPHIYKIEFSSKNINLSFLIHSSFASIPSANGERVIISRLRDVEPARYSLVNAIRAFFLVQDLDHLRNGTAKGHRIVFDMTGMVMGHLTRMSPVVLHKFIYYLQVR